jgi:phosphoribosyl 1,2-cyclic phosphate phosphodiesterase
LTLTFLGTGTSTGVPLIACECEVCLSGHPRNLRHRSSVLLEENGYSLLIDAGPDFRTQALRVGLKTLDDVLLTHAHSDHILGLDDLRPVSWAKGITVWGAEETLEKVCGVFPYIFGEATSPSSRPRLRLQPLDAGKCTSVGPWKILPLEIQHGPQQILGFRIGSVAYLTDCNGIPETTKALLKGIDTVILGVLRHQEHPTHFNVEQGVRAALELGARQTWFTHLGHELDYDQFAAQLPRGMAPAFDGLVLKFPETTVGA